MSENFWNEFDKDNEKEVTERLINSETPEESAPQIDAAPADDVIEPVPQYIEAAEDDVIESAPQYNEADADPQSDAADTAPQYDAAKDNGVDYSSFPYREPDPGPVQNRNIYSNSYGSYQPAQPKPSYTERPSRDYRVDTQELPYNDGFYHKSFTQPNTGAQNTYNAQQSTQQTAAADNNKRKKEKKSGGISKGGMAVLLICCILFSGVAGFGGSLLAMRMNQAQYEDTANDTMVIHKVNTDAVVADKDQLQDKTTAEITGEVADTVVEITTEIMQTNSFYGQYIAQGAGSGVIISDDGYIVTNNHVIDGASSIKVTTRSGDSYDATLIGTDPEVDVALIKINATGLTKAVFGNSDDLTVGDKAVIIGNPLGTLGGSVTEGIISALDRSIVIDGKTMHLMQTDAAINPGNSGGGMFNGQGELAGIVVAKSSSAQESIDNIGFVIPINNVMNIIGDLKDYGYVRGRADTGMTFIDLSNMMYAWYYYGNNEAGVYINSVESGSNAEKAGFRKGDRVVKVDGQEISKADDIASIIAGKSVGDTISFELNRGGSSGTLELTLQEDVPETVNNKNTENTENQFGNNGNNGNNNSNGNSDEDDFFGSFRDLFR